MTTPGIRVHPSLSRRPLPLDARDLASICLPCSPDGGVRLDVEGGRIAWVRPDESNPTTQGLLGLLRGRPHHEATPCRVERL